MRSEGMITPDPGDRLLFKKDLISQFAKELSFKKYFERQQRGPLAVSLTRHRRVFSRNLFRRDVTPFVSALL